MPIQIEFHWSFGIVYWDANLGGSLSNLTVDGADIVVKAEDAGHYHVRLDLTQWPYQATLTK